MIRKRKVYWLGTVMLLAPAAFTLAGGFVGFSKGVWWTPVGAVAGLVAGYLVAGALFYLLPRGKSGE